MNWYVMVLKNYLTFSGRARRKEFWMFYLFHAIACTVLGFIDGILGLGFLVALYVLGTMIPYLAVLVRRLHDTNKTGWLALVGFIPVVGVIWLLIITIKEGDQGSNQYGANPKVA